jgi:hypothetical protein
MNDEWIVVWEEEVVAYLHLVAHVSTKLTLLLSNAIESFAHDSGQTLVIAEYGYSKGSPNTSS